MGVPGIGIPNMAQASWELFCRPPPPSSRALTLGEPAERQPRLLPNPPAQCWIFVTICDLGICLDPSPNESRLSFHSIYRFEKLADTTPKARSRAARVDEFRTASTAVTSVNRSQGRCLASQDGRCGLHCESPREAVALAVPRHPLPRDLEREKGSIHDSADKQAGR